MKLIFIHPRFPDRFFHILKAFEKIPGTDILFITEKDHPKIKIKNVATIPYKTSPVKDPISSWVIKNYADSHAIGQEVAKTLENLKNKGIIPDLIIGQSGSGATLYVKDVFPEIPFLNYMGWFTDPNAIQTDLQPDAIPDLSERMDLRNKNLPILTDLIACDHAVCPTQWQKSQVPGILHDKTSVIHDGIDTILFNPDKKTKIEIPGFHLSDEEELITFISNIPAPFKGVPRFLEALPQVLLKRPKTKVILAGIDWNIFGGDPSERKTYKTLIFEKMKCNPKQVYFFESLSPDQYLQVLLASTIHVYIGFPFQLSRTMLEAMACKCLVIAPDTQPIKEVITDGANGFTLDFKDPKQIAQRIIACLEYPSFMEKVRQKACQTINEKYALKKELPRHLELIKRMGTRARTDTRFG